MFSYTYHVFADYQQFYLMVDDRQPLIPQAASAEDCRRRIKVAPHMMVVSSARTVTVPVTIEVLNAEPSLDLSAWDHVVECSLEVPSGRVVLGGCTDYPPDCARFELTPGTYRARVLYGALGTSIANEIEGDEHYQISLWPAPARELQIIKQYEEAAAIRTLSEGSAAQALVDETPDDLTAGEPISVRRQEWATRLGAVVAFCALIWFMFILIGLETMDSDAPFAGLPFLVGLILTFPPAILFTVTALLLAGPRRAKLAWMSFCLYLLPILCAFGVGIWESISKKF